MPAFVFSDFLYAMREELADNPALVILAAAVIVMVVGLLVIDRLWIWRERRRVMAAHRLESANHWRRHGK